MKRALALSLFLVGCAPSHQEVKPTPPTAAAPQPMAYPVAEKGGTVDDYSGTKVADPYRWLEDPSSPQTRAWIDAENKLTFDYLGKLPHRAEWEKRLTELSDYERYESPVRRGRWYFYRHNDGLQNQPVVWKMLGADGTPAVLLDPNTLSKDGTVALGELSFTDEGDKLAYSISRAGSDWVEWHVLDVATGKELPDVIKWSKFSGAAFTKDGSGFFYSRFPEPKAGAALEEANYFQQLCFHKLGTDQSKDELAYEDRDNKARGVVGEVTDDGHYLVLHISEGTDRRSRLYYKELGQRHGSKVVRLLDGFDASYAFVGNRGATFFVQTDLDAPRGKLVAIDLRHPSVAAWKTLLAEEADKLEHVHHVGKGFLVERLHRAVAAVQFHDESGKKLRDVQLPGLGVVTGFDARPDDTETFFSYSSFTTPATVYRLDLSSGASTMFRTPKTKFSPDDFDTQQVTYVSKDGTEIPMFLVFRKGLEKTGNAPTLLYGYGGFDISYLPEFSTKVIAWVEKGGIFAQPSLRGGGEFGESWHQAGMLAKKQTVFDDFAYAARWLVSSGFTRASKLAISGRSNGGLLVGASLTQHPELFGAAVATVGVMDMLRFDQFTIGHAWTSEYGVPADPAAFPVLRAYSPLHNVKSGTHYPPTLIVTGDHDDRVVPAHSFKFTAALQAAQAGPAPVLIRIDVATGHGSGKPLHKQIAETADTLAFLSHALE